MIKLLSIPDSNTLTQSVNIYKRGACVWSKEEDINSWIEDKNRIELVDNVYQLYA